MLRPRIRSSKHHYVKRIVKIRVYVDLRVWIKVPIFSVYSVSNSSEVPDIVVNLHFRNNQILVPVRVSIHILNPQVKRLHIKLLVAAGKEIPS